MWAKVKSIKKHAAGIVEVEVSDFRMDYLKRPKRYFSFIMSNKILLKMSVADMLHVQPGDEFSLLGVAKFHKKLWGDVGKTTKSQQIISIRADASELIAIGTITTSDYKCTIGEKEFNSPFVK